jgi:hypothetical protein
VVIFFEIDYDKGMNSIWSIAKKSLEENCVETMSGPMTMAASHQFNTFWVRDFCYSVPGLLALGSAEQVRDQLMVCLEHQREDGLVARGFDVVNPKLRVFAESFRMPWLLKKVDYSKMPLKPEYLGEHGTPAADSNILVLLACLQWTEKTGSRFFLDEHSAALESIYKYILMQKVDTFIVQPGFSDWQDSARRCGQTFYLNLLFFRVLMRLQKEKVSWSFSEDLDSWRSQLWSSFYDSQMGLFRNQSDVKQFSLETQLWSIEEDLFADFVSRTELWRSLKSSPLWKPMAGRPVWPDYPANEISWTTKLVGLRHYHDQFYWSWLIAESLKVAIVMKSEADIENLTALLGSLVERYGTVHEIYEMKDSLVPVERVLYRAERPFSWGAAKIIEAMAQLSPDRERSVAPLPLGPLKVTSSL